VLLGFALLPQSFGALDLNPVVTCEQFMVPKKNVNGKMVGQENCRMREITFEWMGRQFKRIEIGITGTTAGYAIKAGANEVRYANYFNEYPEVVYQQGGVKEPYSHGIGRYTMQTGHMVSLIFPTDRGAWNGKLFLHNHGAGRSFAQGNALSWELEFDPADPNGGLQDLGRYEKTMLEKGYALAKTRRSTLMQGGDVTVTLDDGTVLRDRNLTEQPSMIMGWAKLAGNVLNDRMGAQPSRTYWYGHSGGARPGRMVNYKEGINIDADGTPIIDGIIVDDAGSGLWVPIAMKDGKDTILMTDEQKRHFVPMIEISHLLYVNETHDDPPDFRGGNNFLANKRINAKTLMEKGLGDKFRYYEIDGISHSGPGSAPSPPDRMPDILDMDLLMEGFIDLLDAWVEKGVAPPPNRSDWRVLGDANRDNVVENPAIEMPEVTCPLGVFHIYGAGNGTGSTKFSPFTGAGLEPLDGRGEFRADEDIVNVSAGWVDMNNNGYRDFVESVSDAWQRMGLLKPNELFTRDKYVACVQQSATKLVNDKFFMPRTLNKYLEKARTMPLPLQ
jgi:hypothetical protein